MKRRSAAEFRKDIASGAIPPVIFLIGEDEYLRRDLLDALKQKRPQAESWDGQEHALGDVLASAEQMTLGGGGRLLIVSHAAEMMQDEEALAAYLKNPASDAVLVFCLESLDARKKITRVIEDAACIVEVSEQRGAELGAEIQRLLKRFGQLSFDKEAWESLWEWVGKDLNALSREMEKLAAAFPEKKTLRLEDLEGLVFRQETQNVFDWIHAMATGRRKEAMLLWKGLTRDGAGVLELLGLLRSQAEKLFAAREMLAAGKAANTVCQALKIPPFFCSDFAARAKKMQAHSPKRFFAELLACEKAVKTSLFKDEIAGELLVMKLGKP